MFAYTRRVTPAFTYREVDPWRYSRHPGEVAVRGDKKRILAIQKLCRISAALRHELNGDIDFVGFFVIRNKTAAREDESVLPKVNSWIVPAETLACG